MPEHLYFPWNDHDGYRQKWNALMQAKDTVRADDVVELPGFLPGLWLTQGTASLIHRAAFPCPARIGLKRLRQCVTFLYNRVWVDERLGAYAGHFRNEDLVLEAMSETLVLDCGEPTRCHFAFILHQDKLLAATQNEFSLDDDFWVERILMRSKLSPFHRT